MSVNNEVLRSLAARKAKQDWMRNMHLDEQTADEVLAYATRMVDNAQESGAHPAVALSAFLSAFMFAGAACRMTKDQLMEMLNLQAEHLWIMAEEHQQYAPINDGHTEPVKRVQ